MDYSRFEFAPYVYIEYPKWVDGKGGPVVVKDADEEAAVLAETIKKRSKDS